MNLRPHRPLLGRSSALPLAILALVSSLAGGCSSSSGRAVARVGDDEIQSAEFVHAAESMPAQTLDPSPEGKRRLLDELVSRSLLVAEAKRRGYDKSPELAQALRAAREEALPQLLYARLVGDRVRVTDDEARAIWERQNEEWRLSQIFCFSEPEARQAVERLRRGTSFGNVALSASRDRQTGMAGGDLGYLTSGQIPREMEEAVRRLKVGQWAGPLRTPVGWYLVQVTDRRPRQREAFETTRENLLALLRQRKERTLVLAYVSRLKLRRNLTANQEGYQLLALKWQNKSVDDLLQSRGDPARLGFTLADLATPVATWDGGAYTVKDFFTEMMERSGSERPPAQDDAALHIYVEDRAVSRMIVDEARAMGLDRDPDMEQRLRDREASYLITRLYEEVIVPSSQATAEEQERLRAHVGTQMQSVPPGADTTGMFAHFRDQLLQGKRRRVLDELIARLRREHPPRVNERALAAVPWPIAPKENS
jgi:peptidyl-prolyl cis-trans isomerase C